MCLGYLLVAYSSGMTSGMTVSMSVAPLALVTTRWSSLALMPASWLTRSMVA